LSLSRDGCPGRAHSFLHSRVSQLLFISGGLFQGLTGLPSGLASPSSTVMQAVPPKLPTSSIVFAFGMYTRLTGGPAKAASPGG
jgi:hypothetical protein